MIILINENNQLKRDEKNSGILRSLKIKLGHWIYEGLNFKLVHKYGILTLTGDNEIWTNYWRIKLRHMICLEALDFKWLDIYGDNS